MIKSKILVLVSLLFWIFVAEGSNQRTTTTGLDSDFVFTGDVLDNVPEAKNGWIGSGYCPMPWLNSFEKIVEKKQISGAFDQGSESCVFSKEDEPKGKEDNPASFVTHSLIILVEQNPENFVTLEEMKFIFKSKLLVLFSATMRGFFLQKEVIEEQIANGYHFFGLPGALKSAGKAFILGVPQKMLGDDFEKAFEKFGIKSLNSNEGGLSQEVTELEKKLGILITHLQYLGTATVKGLLKGFIRLKAQTEKDVSMELKRFLSNFFVPKKMYANEKDVPRWIVVIEGEGRRVEFHENLSDIKDNQVVKDVGGLASLDPDILPKIIEKMVGDIRLVWVHFFSCFFGPVKLVELAKKISSNHPIFTAMSFSGNGVVNGVVKEDGYKNFLEHIKAFVVNENFLNQELCKVAFKFYTEAVQHLAVEWPGCPTSVMGSSVPFFKSPYDKSFWPVPQYFSTQVLQSVNALNEFSEKQADVKVPVKSSVILLDGSLIDNVKIYSFTPPENETNVPKNSVKPVYFKEKKDKVEKVYPYFSSGVPGSLFQVINTVRVPERFKACPKVLRELFPDFFDKHFEGKICLRVKNVEGIKNIHKAKFYVARCQKNNGAVAHAVFVCQKNKEAQNKSYWYFGGAFGFEPVERECSKEAAKEWIKVFKQEAKFREKQSIYMKKYLLQNKELADNKSVSAGKFDDTFDSFEYPTL
ncbi:TPA: hypothetical protein DDZ86_05040 [Candidatus Dependentiae bacterium]|nr:MAG: hypothetical protein A2Y17_09845 [Clostridiales bacterium GWF2_38_85]HBL98977.1 hypothetical protein [Candidatus Dependentiae bacterium]